MQRRSSVEKRGAEEARNTLPELLDAAEKGRPTVITRHGREIAALVPIRAFERRVHQSPLLPLAGSGKGLWGQDSAAALAAMRDEWGR